MQIIESPAAVQALCQQWRHARQEIGFVPTMGALHEGHLALAHRARLENQRFVASIFVNPIQFRPNEDLAKYPRPFQRDCELLAAAGCNLLFAPTPESMYGNDGDCHTLVDVDALSTRWEGAARPGHFRGVSTVVAKLFNIALPHRAYFGEKDFQQLQVLRRMVKDLNFPLEIVPCPTIRESDGLALSSRNVYLGAPERAAAPTIFHALTTARDAARNGERCAQKLLDAMQAVLAKEPLFVVEYCAVVDTPTLEPLAKIDDQNAARALVAVRVGNTRLIDNIALNDV